MRPGHLPKIETADDVLGQTHFLVDLDALPTDDLYMGVSRGQKCPDGRGIRGSVNDRVSVLDFDGTASCWPRRGPLLSALRSCSGLQVWTVILMRPGMACRKLQSRLSLGPHLTLSPACQTGGCRVSARILGPSGTVPRCRTFRCSPLSSGRKTKTGHKHKIKRKENKSFSRGNNFNIRLYRLCSNSNAICKLERWGRNETRLRCFGASSSVRFMLVSANNVVSDTRWVARSDGPHWGSNE